MSTCKCTGGAGIVLTEKLLAALAAGCASCGGEVQFGEAWAETEERPEGTLSNLWVPSLAANSHALTGRLACDQECMTFVMRKEATATVK